MYKKVSIALEERSSIKDVFCDERGSKRRSVLVAFDDGTVLSMTNTEFIEEQRDCFIR